MTLNPKEDLAKHVRFIAEYDDGSEEVFAVPQATLDQGPGALRIARVVASEWQRYGHLKPGTIVSIRRPSVEELIEMYGSSNAAEWNRCCRGLWSPFHTAAAKVTFPDWRVLTREETMPFELIQPTMVTFIISVVLAVIAAVIHYAGIPNPITYSGFVILLLGYLVLLAGNVIRAL